MGRLVWHFIFLACGFEFSIRRVLGTFTIILLVNSFFDSVFIVFVILSAQGCHKGMFKFSSIDFLTNETLAWKCQLGNIGNDHRHAVATPRSEIRHINTDTHVTCEKSVDLTYFLDQPSSIIDQIEPSIYILLGSLRHETKINQKGQLRF